MGIRWGAVAGLFAMLVLVASCKRPLPGSEDVGLGGAGGASGTGGAVAGAAGGGVAGAGGAVAGSGGGGGVTPGGTACGDLIGTECTGTRFCEAPAGDCGRMQIAGAQCIERPTLCPPSDYFPECGCDGKVYGSDCERRAAGVSLFSLGECDGTGKPCRSQNGMSAACAASHFCEIATGSCNNDNVSPGVCLPRPPSCDPIHRPVCGCNGRSYPNDCERWRDGVPKLSDGVCPIPNCPSSPPEPGTPCTQVIDVCSYTLFPGCQADFGCTGNNTSTVIWMSPGCRPL